MMRLQYTRRSCGPHCRLRGCYAGLLIANSVPCGVQVQDMDLTRSQARYVKALLGWLLFSTLVVAALNWKQPVKHAVTSMGLGLVLLWVVLCGGLMWRFRTAILRRVMRIRLPWQLRFVLFCTLLALSEEAITTLMTNTAPLFGLRIGQAYITASSNYLCVILLHGVSLFVSFFVGWAVILSRYRFSPFSVFILFGITGTLIEALYGGWPHILEYGMWAFVYGLMVWLPAGTAPLQEAVTGTGEPVSTTRRYYNPRWYHYPIAVFVPLAFAFLFPLLGVISVLYRHHPAPFPPMGR